MITPVPPEYRWDTIPEILYEAPSVPGEPGNPIPYIDVPLNKKMPPLLFVFEYKRTGEYEPDHKGRPAEVVDQVPHKYVDLQYLLDRIDTGLHDVVRCALGMKPLEQAKQEGRDLINKVLGKETFITQQAISSQPGRVEQLKQQHNNIMKAEEKRQNKNKKRKQNEQ